MLWRLQSVKMETVELDMDDIFDHQDEGALQEGLGGQTAMLPELEDGEQPMAEADEGEEEGAQLNRLRDLSKGAAKKRIQRPQPKLDAERLKGERGLAILPKIFENVKFKGKGHEAADLQLMMGKLEHWAHRLFPKLPFDSFIERIEKLGKKAAVQNCVKRIRLDMPILDSDYVTQFEDPNEVEPEQQPINVQQDNEMDAEEAFEEMLRQERELQKQRREADEEDPFADMMPSSTTQPSRPGPPSPLATPATPTTPAPPTTPAFQSTKTVSSASTSLSDEQKAEMERKKQLALEKRAARLGIPVSALVTPKKPLTSEKVTSHLNPAGEVDEGDNGGTMDINDLHGASDTRPAGKDLCQNTSSQPTRIGGEEASCPDSVEIDQMNDVEKRTSQSSLQSPLADQEGPTLLDRLTSRKVQDDSSSEDMTFNAITNKLDIEKDNDFSKEEETLGVLQIDLATPVKTNSRAKNDTYEGEYQLNDVCGEEETLGSLQMDLASPVNTNSQAKKDISHVDDLNPDASEEDGALQVDLDNPADTNNMVKKDLSHMDKLNHNVFEDEQGETLGALQMDMDSESVPLL